MGWDSLVRWGVSFAKSFTADLQDNVTHYPWISRSTSGTPTYDTGVPLSAVIEQGPKPFRTSAGDIITIKAMLYILQPITANGATGRHEPVDPRDYFVLPDGTTGAPIEGYGGLVDPSTNKPYFHMVPLG